jgi:hypothetical protein
MLSSFHSVSLLPTWQSNQYSMKIAHANGTILKPLPLSKCRSSSKYPSWYLRCFTFGHLNIQPRTDCMYYCSWATSIWHTAHKPSIQHTARNCVLENFDLAHNYVLKKNRRSGTQLRARAKTSIWHSIVCWNLGVVLAHMPSILYA